MSGHSRWTSERETPFALALLKTRSPSETLRPGTFDYYLVADRAPKYDVIDTEFGTSYGCYRPAEPDTSLYRRIEAPVTMEDGHVAQAWVYFYNAPLGQAQRIESGDYLEHLRVK